MAEEEAKVNCRICGKEIEDLEPYFETEKGIECVPCYCESSEEGNGSGSQTL